MKKLVTGVGIALLGLTLSGCPFGNKASISPGTTGIFPVGWVYSTLYARNAIVEIDTLQSRVTKDPIIVPDGPKAIAIDPRGSGQFMYVVCERANVVAVVDRRNRLANRTISVGNKPYGIAITPNGERAFVTNTDDDTVTVIELKTQTVVDTISLNTPQATQPGGQQPAQTRMRPQGVAVNWNGTRVYVACASGQVVLLEGTPTSRYSAIRNVTLSGSVAPQNIAVASDNTNETAYVTDPSGNRLFFFSPAQGTQSAEVRDIQGAPWGLAVGRNPQNPTKIDRLYVTAKNGNALYPLTLPDLQTATMGGQGVSVEGKEPTYVAVSPQGNQVYVALTGSNNIAVFERVGGDLARPEVYNFQQLDPQFIAPTGDIGLAPFLYQ